MIHFASFANSTSFCAFDFLTSALTCPYSSPVRDPVSKTVNQFSLYCFTFEWNVKYLNSKALPVVVKSVLSDSQSIQGIEGSSDSQSQVNCIGAKKLLKREILYLIEDLYAFFLYRQL